MAGLWLIADWVEDEALVGALTRLPGAMRDATSGDGFAEAETVLAARDQAMVIARGVGLGLAHEAALKLLETCAIHASSYSGAEVLHGPSALLTDGYPVLALTTGAGHGMDQALARLPEQGARVVALPEQSGVGHPLVDPLLDVQPIYRMAERLSQGRGMNPDDPPHLKKETKTI